MWVSSMTLKYVHYILWTPQKQQEYVFIIPTFKLTLGKLGGVILVALNTLIIVHPSIFHMKHYSSQYCSYMHYSLSILV